MDITILIQLLFFFFVFIKLVQVCLFIFKTEKVSNTVNWEILSDAGLVEYKTLLPGVYLTECFFIIYAVFWLNNLQIALDFVLIYLSFIVFFRLIWMLYHKVFTKTHAFLLTLEGFGLIVATIGIYYI